MITTNLRARNLEEAWLRGMKEIMDKGREYRKDDSTRAGMLRKALDFLSIEITHPEDRPLVPLSKPGCISTCSEADAEKYLLEKPILIDVNFQLIREGKVNPEIERLHEFEPL